MISLIKLKASSVGLAHCKKAAKSTSLSWTSNTNHPCREREKMRDTVTILGIWGMAGIGKTTRAKEVYNCCAEILNREE